MSKFNKLFNKIISEMNIGNNLKITTDTILPVELCNPENCYRWKKGQVNVYAHKITEDDIDECTKLLKSCRENTNVVAQPGKFIVYNPNIDSEAGQIWMNKLTGYILADSLNSAFKELTIIKDDLQFNEYIYLPKDDNLIEGIDIWSGFQIPVGKNFVIQAGCGTNGSDGSTAFETDWLAIVNGKFDWARSRESMKQSNCICLGKIDTILDENCLNTWMEFIENEKN